MTVSSRRITTSIVVSCLRLLTQRGGFTLPIIHPPLDTNHGINAMSRRLDSAYDLILRLDSGDVGLMIAPERDPLSGREMKRIPGQLTAADATEQFARQDVPRVY